jgi:hypothetical protein
MNEYASLSELRTFMSLASAEVSDDAELRNILTRSSRSIDRYTRRHFYPRRYGGTNTLKYDIPDNGLTLNVGNIDLLEVKGLSDLNGASEIGAGAYWLKAGDNWNISPYDRIVLSDSAGSVFSFSGTTQRAVHVDAIAGYREDYGYAWVNSGASLTDILPAATTIASVSASGAANSEGISPRFKQSQILRIGTGASEEFLYIQDTVNSSRINVIRGINGTSDIAHAASTSIFTWQPEYDIEESVVELAAFAYQKAKSPFTNRVSILSLGVIEHPEAWPEKTIERLQRYKKDEIYAL